MIISFKDRETEKIWNSNYSKKYSNKIQKVMKRKLLHIHSAININDLKIPPGNQLHILSGDRKKQYNIRVNQQYRICFIWKNRHAYEVELVDYH